MEVNLYCTYKQNLYYTYKQNPYSTVFRQGFTQSIPMYPYSAGLGTESILYAQQDPYSTTLSKESIMYLYTKFILYM